jgi:hypothetical protein
VAKSHEFTGGSPSVKNSQNSPGSYAGSVGEMPVADSEKIAKNRLTSEGILGRGEWVAHAIIESLLNFLSAVMNNDGISDITEENGAQKRQCCGSGAYLIPDPYPE